MSTAITNVSSSPVYYPRVACRLTIVLRPNAPGSGVQGANGKDLPAETVSLEMIPNKATWTRQSHNKAGTCEVEFLATTIPFEIRNIEGVYVQIFATGGAFADDTAIKDENLRFCGFADKMDDKRGKNGNNIAIHCRDLSGILRDAKDIPVSALPKYNDTIESAISRVLKSVPGVVETKIPSIRDLSVISTSVGQAIDHKGDAHIPVPPKATAWQIIEHVCGLVSLLVSVDLQDVVVRLPSEVYGNKQTVAHTFIFNADDANLLEIERERKFLRNRKGVKAVAYNPTTRKQVVAIYPADNKLPPLRRPTPGKSQHKKTKPHVPSLSEQKQERDVFALRGAYTQDALNKYAERVFREKAFQEMSGHMTTPFWDDRVLDLQNGDRVRISVSPGLEAELRNQPDEKTAADFLVRRLGIEREVASVLARVAIRPQTDLFYVDTVTVEWSSKDVAMVKIGFINLIEVGEI